MPPFEPGAGSAEAGIHALDSRHLLPLSLAAPAPGLSTGSRTSPLSSLSLSKRTSISPRPSHPTSLTIRVLLYVIPITYVKILACSFPLITMWRSVEFFAPPPDEWQQRCLSVVTYRIPYGIPIVETLPARSTCHGGGMKAHGRSDGIFPCVPHLRVVTGLNCETGIRGPQIHSMMSEETKTEMKSPPPPPRTICGSPKS